jgi:hypothetical protein
MENLGICYGIFLGHLVNFMAIVIGTYCTKENLATLPIFTATQLILRSIFARVGETKVLFTICLRKKLPSLLAFLLSKSVGR